MKIQRNLSGIYFRSENQETGKWENWCFEDLPEAGQDKVIRGYNAKQLGRLAKQLANTLNKIGNKFDIYSQ